MNTIDKSIIIRSQHVANTSSCFVNGIKEPRPSNPKERH